MKFNETFTNAPLLSGGIVICPACNHMKTAEIPGVPNSAGKLYRSNMWYACEVGLGPVRFAKKINQEPARDLGSVFALPERSPRSILVDPPKPPFAIYFTRTWKKSGWQALMRLGGVNQSRECFLVGFDYDPVFVGRSRLLSHLAFIDRLREKGVHKSELETGRLSTKTLAKLDQDITIMNRLRDLAGNPFWTLAVYVA